MCLLYLATYFAPSENQPFLLFPALFLLLWLMKCQMKPIECSLVKAFDLFSNSSFSKYNVAFSESNGKMTPQPIFSKRVSYFGKNRKFANSYSYF